MNDIKFRMVAYTGAAGKYDPQAPMSGNEDNFYVDDNLSDEFPNHYSADDLIDMNECGCIMAVCDGMGGMNAGEVASAIAVQTIQDYFAPSKILADIAISAKERENYLEKIVVEADKRIKEDAKRNAEHNGMGSTIILAWIVGNELTVTWCGDSRAYKFSPDLGLELLSEDHSYVQDLVKKGLITYDDTFDHPQGNIITRSLGDPSKKAQPETRHFFVGKDDIILLCSDGLSGVLRDRKTKDPDGDFYGGDNIEDVIRNNSSTMTDCKNALWKAAKAADWYDNVTILLCQIVENPIKKDDIINKTVDSYQKKNTFVNLDVERGDSHEANDKKNNRNWNDVLNFQVKIKPITLIFSVIGIIGIAIVFFSINRFLKSDVDTFKDEQSALYERIQGRVDFMQESGLTIDSLYFNDIKNLIAGIHDSISCKDITEKVDIFIEELDRKTEVIKNINKAINRHSSNPQIVNQLNLLKRDCLKNICDIKEFENKIENIESKDGGKSGSAKKKEVKTDELTPIDGNILKVEFKMFLYPQYIQQIDSIRNEYEAKGYAYIGIYLGDTKVESKNYVASKIYNMQFNKK